MKTKPIVLFEQWLEEQMKATKVSIPAACCLSTIGLDSYPNARFVALKGIVDNNFIVTGPLSSRKGMEIKIVNKVALTFWWTETERQIRIQGNARTIDNNLADIYFSERNKNSQIVSFVSEQGQEVNNVEALNQKFKEMEKNFANKPLTRPENWGGFSIKPIRMEFLEFKPSRLHHRKLFQLKKGQWQQITLQP